MWNSKWNNWCEWVPQYFKIETSHDSEIEWKQEHKERVPPESSCWKIISCLFVKLQNTEETIVFFF